jgi:hypothetical protein
MSSTLASLIQLQQGLERGSLDRSKVLKLLFQQLLGTALEKVLDQWRYSTLSRNADDSSKLEKYIDVHLERTVEMQLLEAYLELEVSEMEDPSTKILFDQARGVLQTRPLRFIMTYLTLLKEVTSIGARVATLASFTAHNARPVLIATAVAPLIDRLINAIPWERENSSSCTSPRELEITLRLQKPVLFKAQGQVREHPPAYQRNGTGH